MCMEYVTIVLNIKVLSKEEHSLLAIERLTTIWLLLLLAVFVTNKCEGKCVPEFHHVRLLGD